MGTDNVTFVHPKTQMFLDFVPITTLSTLNSMADTFFFLTQIIVC